jgi:imidazole glycerol-phosphate synthase subunit HisF
VVSIDVKKNLWGKYEVYTHSGTKASGLDPVTYAMQMEKNGAGELIINSIDQDGSMKGYDLDLIQSVTSKLGIPVVACGGAGNVTDLSAAVHKGGASAAGAGSIFVFHGPHRAVLISYPGNEDLKKAFGK